VKGFAKHRVLVFASRLMGRDSELDPCLAWVRRTQKAAAKSARFGVHFTQMYSFPVVLAYSRYFYLEHSRSFTVRFTHHVMPIFT
jgi:hypothetical protein